MTITKGQGKTLQVAGLHLQNQCLSHAQLRTWHIQELECQPTKQFYILYNAKTKAVNIFLKMILKIIIVFVLHSNEYDPML